ncbi:glycoside hydrolase [Arachidicoccus ginsenosidimutans]|uniref:glycoside hydrolase family 31 protein n=1 Tax=Arachidicoccus sp. BS20 TaxID=1850526 RepID=UPI0007F12B83|nr:TIM-barrel domain-containing protein [Arachidicoccus sp. BS20]ANI87956.1 glycoside hydrolase [Arachidicoccus sp. BS20]
MHKKFSIALCAAVLTGSLFAQNNQPKDSKVFWSENFKSGKLPDGWKNVDEYNKGAEWIVTDQPFPGSYQYQQQAPPIASKSRGAYLTYQPGYLVDEDQASWVKKHEYPDAYIQTTAINCADKNSVVLKFQQTFRYNNFNAEKNAGLYVGISTDSGKTWHDINVMEKEPASTDMLVPLKEEINISQYAAHQTNVMLRFYWRGYYSWYWMIDDIELAEAYQNDVAITRLLSHSEEDNDFKKNDRLVVQLKNTGSETISSNFTVKANVDDKELSATVDASTHPLKSGETVDVTFPAMDLTNKPVHKVHFKTNLDNDERKDNNELWLTLNAKESSIGNISAFKKDNAHEFTFTSGPSKIKLIFYSNDIFRLWLTPDGEFTNPADSEIVVDYSIKNPQVNFSDAGDYYKFQTPDCVVRAYKNPLRFGLYDKTNTKEIWQESKSLQFGAHTIQTMVRQPNEYFYGGGMQNGYFSHRGKTILIEKGGGWDDGGRANPAPFYMSTAGYGAFRNTFDIGKYAFLDTLSFSHNENRFDCFYFYGPSLKNILNEYTETTGRPFMIPRWGLSLGDANCYNRGAKKSNQQMNVGSHTTGHNGTTPDVINIVADKYIENNMPRGWILPNDGYGCGYTDLDSTVKELHKRGFWTGLWTGNGVEQIAKEVGQYGTRLCKLDVAWVGPGYKFGLDGCRTAYEGIENNSNARGFIWSVMGWAGTQRYSTIWSGDQYGGNWEYIRFHIPTVIGSGLSGFNYATGDVDGIFGGKDTTYVRDLEWKSFTPVFMVMSGWAKKDKQPYIYGEPYTSINRKYLELKMRMTPYMYTLCADAHETGVPAVRGMVLEFPKDSVTWGTATQYQFMYGSSLLVAPVYEAGETRDSIYLPKGEWFDYFTGDKYNGNQWLRHFDAPLDKLPVFVKTGAIIPLYPAMNYDAERRADTLTLDIYPSGKSSFNMYEDDGITRDYQKGGFARTLIESSVASDATSITINAAKGNYNGKYLQRYYTLLVHGNKTPKAVYLNGKKINSFSFDANDKHGIIHIQTNALSTATTQKIVLKF